MPLTAEERQIVAALENDLQTARRLLGERIARREQRTVPTTADEGN